MVSTVLTLPARPLSDVMSVVVFCLVAIPAVFCVCYFTWMEVRKRCFRGTSRTAYPVLELVTPHQKSESDTQERDTNERSVTLPNRVSCNNESSLMSKDGKEDNDYS